MADPRGDGFYIVRADILPEAIQKTARAKELIARGEAATVNEAVAKISLSRSAYYKYKDGIYPFYSAGTDTIVAISLRLEHQSGVLSKVLNTIALFQGNILTINQNIPLQGLADVFITIQTAGMQVNLQEVLDSLGQIPGVVSLQLMAQG